MNANLNAIGLIIVIVITIIALIKCDKQSITLKNILVAILGPFWVSFLNVTFNTTLCIGINPVMQWLIPAICLYFVNLLLKSSRVKKYVQYILIISSFILSYQFPLIAKQAKYTGDLNYVKFMNRINKKHKTGKSYKGYYLWHSYLTGIYGVQKKEKQNGIKKSIK